MNYDAVDEAIRAGEAARVVPTICRDTLAEIADGRRELYAARHPLGFLCLPVHRDGEYGVCVHVWSPALARAHATTSEVHSHSWDLVSFVLYGRVGNTLLHVADDAVAATHRVFEIHSHGDIDEIRATPRRVRYLTARHCAAGPGGTYRVPTGRFHASVIEDGRGAATVVLGRSRRSAIDLSLGPLDTPTHRVLRQRCGAGETADAARMVLRRLAGRDAREG
ncbi:MAG TPA: hypothetical protein VFX70_17635 [Mycobacteriales bacterium]|nr:hypothetical protein [Mycobacteriales bacterium]